MKEKPVVSVCMITYNHEAYIAQAIDGVLMQKTDFPFELVIGDDCSTDRTREICLEFQRKYPTLIRLLPRSKNLGMIPNFIDTLKNCEAKYIALCEGDDYWENKERLKYQVEFLEANLEYAGVGSRARRYLQTEDRFESDFYYKFLELKDRENINTERLLYGFFIYTATMLFRNGLFDPEILRGKCFGDKFVQYLVSTKGDFCFFNQEDTVYRVHKQSAMHTVIPGNPYLFYKDHLEFLRFFDDYTDNRFKSAIEFRQNYLKPLMNISDRNKSVFAKAGNIFKYFGHKDARHSVAEYKNLLALAFPKAVSNLKRLRLRKKK